MTRQYTNQLLEMIENGLLDKDIVINACVNYMSEDDVRDMMESNEFIEEEEEEEEEE
jgi:predicted transcriptional regulator